MKRFGLFGLVAALATASSLVAQPTYDLTLSGGPLGQTIEKPTPGGGTVSDGATIDVVLSSTDDPDGAQGWSISVASENIDIVGITTAGTLAAPVTADPPGLQNGGFEKTELTADARAGNPSAGCPGGGDGAVSAVVLSFTMPITLDASGGAAIAKLDVAGGEFPSGDPGTTGTARVFFVDGCTGAGQPVENNVTWTGNTVKPSLGEGVINLLVTEVPAECPSDLHEFQVIMQSEAVASPGDTDVLFANAVPSIDDDPTMPGLIELPPGPGTVYAGIVSQSENGVQGWSLAVSGEFSEASTAGTAGAPVTADPPGIQNGGFEKTELVDPEKVSDALPGAPQGPGAVSAVVCSFTMPITLTPSGTATVLALGVDGAVGDTVAIQWRSGLQGAGQPVENVATVLGGTVQYGCQQDAEVRFVEPPTKFVSVGDSNDDGRMDLADAIWILNALFRGGPSTACEAASDANSDGMVDSSDAIFIIEYLWLGGTAPAGIGGCVEVDPNDPNSVACAEDSSSC